MKKTNGLKSVLFGGMIAASALCVASPVYANIENTAGAEAVEAVDTVDNAESVDSVDEKNLDLDATVRFKFVDQNGNPVQNVGVQLFKALYEYEGVYNRATDLVLRDKISTNKSNSLGVTEATVHMTEKYYINGLDIPDGYELPDISAVAKDGKKLTWQGKFGLDFYDNFFFKWIQARTLAEISELRSATDVFNTDVFKLTDEFVEYENDNIEIQILLNKKSEKQKELRAGWVRNGDTWSYIRQDSGTLYTGWHYMTEKEGEKTPHWSFFGSDGLLRTGWQYLTSADGESTPHWSYFGSNGWLRTGWVELGKGTAEPDGNTERHWSYFGANGWLRTGWVQLGKGTSEPDGNSAVHWSYFGPNGWLRTYWQELGNGTSNPDGNAPKHRSYFGSNGWLVTDKEVVLGTMKYIADARGWLTKV